jgi:hypothetical protein
MLLVISPLKFLPLSFFSLFIDSFHFHILAYVSISPFIGISFPPEITSRFPFILKEPTPAPTSAPASTLAPSPISPSPSLPKKIIPPRSYVDRKNELITTEEVTQSYLRLKPKFRTQADLDNVTIQLDTEERQRER